MLQDIWLNLVLSIVVLFLFMVSLALGPETIFLPRAFNDVIHGETSVAATILWEIRLPRALIGLFVGASLGLSGAVMQGLLRNPLASPGFTGSAAGAAFFAVVTLYYGWVSIHSQLLPFAAMLGALLATGLVYVLAGRGASIATIILAGVAINSLATAGISLLLNLAPSPYAVQELFMWTLGDLSDRSMDDFLTMLPGTLLGWMLLFGCGTALNALTLGERTAQTLGINVVRLRWRLFVAVSLAIGAGVAVTGMIGFIGLVVPHLLRRLVAFEPAKLLPVSALGGAAMLLAADIGVRLIPTQMSLKVGVLTALVGAPFFLHMVIRSRKDYPQ